MPGAVHGRRFILLLMANLETCSSNLGEGVPTLWGSLSPALGVYDSLPHNPSVSTWSGGETG